MKNIRPVKEEKGIFCFEKFLEKIQEDNYKYIYIGAPSATGKTTLILKLEEVENDNFLFLNFEPDDKETVYLLRTFGEILSRISKEFKEYYKDIKDFSLRPLFTGFKNALKRIKFPEYTYVIMNIQALEDRTEEILHNYFFPLLELIDKKRVIIEGYEESFLFLPEYFKIYDSNYLKLGEEEVQRIAQFYGVSILPNEIVRILDFTDGWILPTILIITQLREGKTLENILKNKENFNQIVKEIIEVLDEKDKRLLYAISQFIRFDENLLRWIFDLRDFKEILKKWERRGIYVEKGEENGKIFFYLNPVIKNSIDDYIFGLKGGEIIYFLLHSKASEYFAEINDFSSALYHSVKTMKMEDISKYFSYSIFDLLEKDKFVFLENIFREIGEKKINETPSLSLYYSIYLCSRRRYEEAYKILERIEDGVFGKEKNNVVLLLFTYQNVCEKCK